MKMYVKPSLEINKFEVENIMTDSGTFGSMSTEAQALYTKYTTSTDEGGMGGTAADTYVEFLW